MKVYSVTIMVIDHDGLGEQDIRDVIENARNPNRCMNPVVMKAESVDIGEWHDNHPLNFKHSQYSEFDLLFNGIE